MKRYSSGRTICVRIAALLSVWICGCVPEQQQVAHQIACDGSPNFCLTARNEMDQMATVYIDGQNVGRVGANSSAKFEVQAGTKHEVNSCYEVVTKPCPILSIMCERDETKKLCTDPEVMRFDSNEHFVIYEAPR